MPNYDYACPNCNKEIEAAHPMSENPKITCPTCGQEMRKRFCVPYIKYGQGWHKPFNWGWKKDTIVSYPDGHCAHRSHNEMYEDGGL